MLAKCIPYALIALGTMTITLKVGFNFTAGNPAQVSAGFRLETFSTAWQPKP